MQKFIKTKLKKRIVKNILDIKTKNKKCIILQLSHLGLKSRSNVCKFIFQNLGV